MRKLSGMNIRILACTALAFMAYGCAAQAEPIRTPSRKDMDGSVIMHYHGMASFTAAERAGIMLAAMQWYEQTSGQVTIIPEWDLEPGQVGELNSILAGDTTWLIPRNRSKLTLGLTHASVDDGPVTITFIRDNFYPSSKITPQWVTVAMHEFGHGLGMRHTKAYSSVMYKEVGDASPACLTRQDLVEFCRVRQCGFYALRPCKD